MTTLDSEQPPYATAKSLRVLGKFREGAADFQVDEVPAYTPEGRGEHLFVRFRKTDLNTADAVRTLALALETRPDEAGFAGLKDRRAITTQWSSFFGGNVERAMALELPGIEVLEASPHSHKLRTGHLRANRFRIVIRGTGPDALPVAREVMDSLVNDGAPNYYGEQRFGRDGDNLPRAVRWIAERGREPRSRFDRKLLVSVWQSHWFNVWLAERMQSVGLASTLRGDLMRKEETGGLFVSEDPEVDRPRVAAWEISATGPMLGAELRWAAHDALALEQDLLARSGVDLARLRELRKLASGARRPLRIRPEDVKLEPVGSDALSLEMTLPKGAYATVILRELMKAEAIDSREPAAETAEDEPPLE
jgi:tRNA pseudouridine13 synthase